MSAVKDKKKLDDKENTEKEGAFKSVMKAVGSLEKSGISVDHILHGMTYIVASSAALNGLPIGQLTGTIRNMYEHQLKELKHSKGGKDA